MANKKKYGGEHVRTPITLTTLALVLFFAANTSAQVAVLSRATVIDGSGAPPQKDVTIVIEGGRIRDIGPMQKIATRAGAAVIDLAGKFIVPGIINAHGHKINLKKLSDGGVRIAFGTDSGGAADRFFIQGFSEHREMELMVQSGLTPMQVIQSFSKSASEGLGIDKEFGTLAKGKAADLLVLDKNPLENITHMQSIQAVYLGGRRFE
ncbi:MAG: amidohydrolase family protein [Deltaproteobacteria bacterium]|nr:amidohydrolase family protein [Deltaproteobacteria bacterium]